MYTCITYYMVVAIASTLFYANELWNKNVSLVFTFQANRSENTAQYFHFVYSTTSNSEWTNKQTNDRMLFSNAYLSSICDYFAAFPSFVVHMLPIQRERFETNT